jgi:hypothetical protein
MDKFVKFLMNVRIGVCEIAGTVGVVAMMAFATYMAWKDYIAPLIR